MTSPATPLLLSDGTEIERVPWSTLGPEFVASWGQPRGKLQPEHLEILGPTGSGKSYLLVDMLRARQVVRGSSIIFIATKAADATVGEFGWPIVDTWRGVQKHDQVVYWPRTRRLGTERMELQAAKIEDLLNHLWQPESNTVVVFDEFAYVETLSPNLKKTLQTYLREGRSHGITVVCGKQRPQGVQRDMSSETDWKVSFRMNDRADNERTAELFGVKREYAMVLEHLDRERHEFLIQHKLTGAQYVSWVDVPMTTKASAQQSTGYRKAA